MIYVLAVIVFLFMGALTRAAPVLALLLIFGGLALAFFLGATSEHIETYSYIIVGSFIGFFIGLISRFIDPD